METKIGTGLQEMFLIKTEAIDFFATLVGEKGGNCIVNGRVRYGDGTFSFFRSPAGELDGLRKTFGGGTGMASRFFLGRF